MTDTEHAPSAGEATITDPWTAALAELRKRWPGAKDGVLFCVWKLQQDAALTLRDFRDEARLRGIPLGGRSLHSAKVLLGVHAPVQRAPANDNVSEPSPQRDGERSSPASLEARLLANIERIEAAAEADARRLRRAIRDAIRVLEDALDDEDE